MVHVCIIYLHERWNNGHMNKGEWFGIYIFLSHGASWVFKLEKWIMQITRIIAFLFAVRNLHKNSLVTVTGG